MENLPLWTLHEITTVLGLPAPEANVALGGVEFDSRAVKPGDLFLAMPGAKADGAEFIRAAEKNGAVVALSARVVAGVKIPQLVVPDVQAALVALGQAARQRFAGPVVGVGGSVGKTTTTAMIKALLNAHAPMGSLNNHVGVPLTLARLPRNAAACVSEIGTNHVGEIAPLAKQVRPDVALITNVVEEHLEGLGSLEAVRLEELTIVQGLPENGLLVVPDDLEITGSGWHGTVRRFNPAAPLQIAIQEPTLARIACANAALAVLAALNIVPEAAALARLAAVAPPEGRGQVQQVRGIAVIDDSYNANPASLVAALGALRQRPAMRRIAVLGDMRELGVEEVRFHTDLVPLVAGLEGVILVGPLMQHLAPLLPAAQLWGAFPNPDDFVPATLALRLHTGDVVLVKGSKSITFTRRHAPRLLEALRRDA
jgi:UDP-N-acetylmuramoyl-tripeptide--D-alanyl-D-alanine ligase